MRRIALVISIGFVVVLLACTQEQQIDTQGGAVAEIADTPTLEDGPLDYEFVDCRTINNPVTKTAWVDAGGDKIVLGSSVKHEFTIKPGVVPDGRRYLYLLSHDSGAGNGCRVLVANVGEGEINSVPDPYTLKIACDGAGNSGNDVCPNIETFVVRLEPQHKIIGGVLENGNRRWVVADLETLSAYALAAPGGAEEEVVP